MMSLKSESEAIVLSLITDGGVTILPLKPESLVNSSGRANPGTNASQSSCGKCLR